MAKNFPKLTRDQTRQVDRLASEQLGMPSIVLMENAGRNAADVVLEVLDELGEKHYFKQKQPRVAIVAGGGNNGGDGYVIARHLYNEGVEVAVFAAKDPGELKGDADVNAKIIANMDLPITKITSADELATHRDELAEADVLVDALLGTGFSGEVRGSLVDVIRALNELREDGATVVAIDVPSGLDCDTGKPSNATIEADYTVTFVAAKKGFTDAAGKFTGRILVADIGAPPELVQRVTKK